MDKVIEERIDTVNNHRTPSGYCRTKDIGLAPIDWTLGKMSDVIKPIKRAVPKPGEPYWRLGIKSWAKGTFHAYVNEPETVDMDELYVVHENDLVVNITFAWEHAIAIACKDDQGLLVSHRFPTYEFKNGQIPDFYKSVISQKLFKDLLEHISPGGAGRNRVLNQKDFLNLPCYIPPLPEQQKIADILATCDKVIELKQKLIEEKRRQKKWLMEEMLLASCSVNYVELSSLCTAIYDGDWIESKDQSEFGIRLLQTGNIGVGRYLDKEGRARFISQETFERLHCTEVFAGDILVSRLPNPIGRACLIPQLSTRTITAVDCTILRFVDSDIARFFLQYATSEEYFNKVTILAGGSTRTRISRKEIERLRIPVPTSKKLMKETSRLSELADYEISVMEQELAEWQQKKKSLMQLLLTGLVRVNI